MILVDSSVWIDFFRNVDTAQAEWLDRHLGDETVIVGDLILAEVLRGFKEDRGFTEAKRLLSRLEQVSLCGEDVAIDAARNYRRLSARGVTVRGTPDGHCKFPHLWPPQIPPGKDRLIMPNRG